MRIAIVISSAEMGGAQRVSFNLAEWINNNSSHHVSIVGLKDSKRNEYDKRSSDYTSLHGERIINSLHRYILNNRIDILLTMGVPLCLYTVPACFNTSVKHIISERNDPAHFAGKKIVKIISRLLMKFADGYVFQTKQARDYYGKKISEKSTIIINPLLNLSKMQNGPFSGERKKTIITVGRLNAQKNQLLLIDAFSEIKKEYPEYHLEIWGDGPLRKDLERRILELKLEDSVLLPGSSNEILHEIYDEGIFVLSSDFEGMPNALMEAMALGLPCISTDCPCGGPKELIDNGINGLLVPPNNLTELINAIRFCIENYTKAVQFGIQAMEIRDVASPSQVAKQWIDFFLKTYRTV